MSDLPSGQWSELLVGHQWPNSASTTAMRFSAQQRAQIAVSHSEYESKLRDLRTTVLGMEQGLTAEDVRGAFLSGELSARKVSESSEAKQKSYDSALVHVSELRASLTEIANQGNSEIHKILSSHRTLSEKVNEVVSTVIAAQSHANAKAAECSVNLLQAIQSIHGADNPETSARQFASANGLDLEGAFGSLNDERIRSRVEEMLQDRTPTAGETAECDSNLAPGHDSNPFSNEEVSLPKNLTATATSSGSGNATDPPAVDAPFDQYSTAAGLVAPPLGGLMGTNELSVQTGPFGSGTSRTETVGPVEMPSGMSASDMRAGQPSIRMERNLSSDSTPTTTGSSQTSQQDLVNNVETLNRIRQANPIVAEGYPATASATGHTAMATQAAPSLLETTPTNTTNLGPEPAHSDTPATIPTQPPPIEGIAPATPAFVPPVTTNLAHLSASSPTALALPQGPLIAYGADLKIPVSTPPTPPIAPAAPISASITPASGTTANGQPALVRQQTATPTASHGTSSPGLTERAFAATSAGAAAGATATRAAAENRLRRLLDTVARQQPHLRWAIGDLEDGTTVLATDLARGWIPPNIDIPVGVQLPQPAAHRNDLDSLLGPVTRSATFRPGQYLSATAEQIPTSIRARDTAPVDDLGWELSQATKWRDGLPRLAHTLAKATAAGTGILGSELNLLREHLTSIERLALNRYPESVDTGIVGNWQLLATIDALIKNQKTSATYHFAWFRAQALMREGH